MSDEIEFPLPSAMRSAAQANRKRRIQLENEAYPIRKGQWRKRIVDQLTGAKMTEADFVCVSPPPSDTLDPHTQNKLDNRVRDELTKELVGMGYAVRLDPGNVAKLIIHWY